MNDSTSLITRKATKLGGGGGGVCNPKNRKKPVPNLKFAVAFGFFGIFRFYVVLFRLIRSKLRQEIPAIQKSSQQ